jgi:hypothetical protein
MALPTIGGVFALPMDSKPDIRHMDERFWHLLGGVNTS